MVFTRHDARISEASVFRSACWREASREGCTLLRVLLINVELRSRPSVLVQDRSPLVGVPRCVPQLFNSRIQGPCFWPSLCTLALGNAPRQKLDAIFCIVGQDTGARRSKEQQEASPGSLSPTHYFPWQPYKVLRFLLWRDPGRFLTSWHANWYTDLTVLQPVTMLMGVQL